jgi:hypothetical protein
MNATLRSALPTDLALLLLLLLAAGTLVML